MENTLSLLAQIWGIEDTNRLILQGNIVVTDKVKYLKIENYE